MECNCPSCVSGDTKHTHIAVKVPKGSHRQYYIILYRMSSDDTAMGDTIQGTIIAKDKNILANPNLCDFELIGTHERTNSHYDREDWMLTKVPPQRATKHVKKFLEDIGCHKQYAVAYRSKWKRSDVDELRKKLGYLGIYSVFDKNRLTFDGHTGFKSVEKAHEIINKATEGRKPSKHKDQWGIRVAKRDLDEHLEIMNILTEGIAI